MPKLKADEKKEDLAKGGSFAGEVVMGSGRWEDRSAGGGAGDKE